MTTTTKQVQSILAISPELKAFFNDCRETFGGAGKVKDYVAASEREIGDSVLAFIEAHRFTEEVEEVEQPMLDDEGNPVLDDEGNPMFETVESLVEVDNFALEVKRTLALRATTSRANSAQATIAKQSAELAEMKALLASLQSQGQA